MQKLASQLRKRKEGNLELQAMIYLDEAISILQDSCIMSFESLSVRNQSSRT